MTKNASQSSTKPSIAIIGAGAAGLAAADFLCQFEVDIHIFEQMPSAGRKILMAGKTGLNLSNNKPMEQFIAQYRPSDWLAPYIKKFSPKDLLAWLDELGVATFVGSSGRIFPTSMKAAPFLRLWLGRLKNQGVHFYYRHRCVAIDGKCLTLIHQDSPPMYRQFDAIILACGGGSYARLGADGAWQAWFDEHELSPLYASNVGVVRTWSPFMQATFGQPLKRVQAWVGDRCVMGDIVITHYGMESGVIYQLNETLRQSLITDNQSAVIYLDLLPDVSPDKLTKALQSANKKHTLTNIWRKAGLDNVKIALVRECVHKSDWHDVNKMVSNIKQLAVAIEGFRPIDEAISTGGGVKRTAVDEHLQLKSNPNVFVCGEMLAWDAPTGGYLLTACFATGRAVGMALAKRLNLATK